MTFIDTSHYYTGEPVGIPDWILDINFLNQKPKSMRAKFECIAVTNYGYQTGGKNETGPIIKKTQSVALQAVYSSGTNKEDNQFAEATPTGKLEMSISNEAALDYFVPGKKYYLDFAETAE